MSRLQEDLAAGHFVVTAEIAPPKGVELQPALLSAASFSGVTAVNVTDNQGANMRMTPLVVAGRMVEAGIEPILQVTCRDRNRMALQSDLLGAYALGIENLLLLSGDHAGFGDHPEARSVFDLDSVQLLRTVQGLQKGKDMAGGKLEGRPEFFPGAAVNPASEPFELMFQKYRKKIEAGARFFQTQAIFDGEGLERFMLEAATLGVPVIAGVLLLRSAAMARFLNANIPGVRVPQNLVDRLEQASDPLAAGVEIARETVARARDCCQGVHLMTLGHDEKITAILNH